MIGPCLFNQLALQVRLRVTFLKAEVYTLLHRKGISVLG